MTKGIMYMKLLHTKGLQHSIQNQSHLNGSTDLCELSTDSTLGFEGVLWGILFIFVRSQTTGAAELLKRFARVHLSHNCSFHTSNVPSLMRNYIWHVYYHIRGLRECYKYVSHFYSLLLAHGAALFGCGFVGEGREAGCRAKQVGGAFALISSLTFL